MQQCPSLPGKIYMYICGQPAGRAGMVAWGLRGGMGEWSLVAGPAWGGMVLFNYEAVYTYRSSMRARTHTQSSKNKFSWIDLGGSGWIWMNLNGCEWICVGLDRSAGCEWIWREMRRCRKTKSI